MSITLLPHISDLKKLLQFQVQRGNFGYMAKEQFSIDGSREILDLIENAGSRAGVARGQAFDYFLTLVVCALAGQTMEEEYLSVVRNGYDQGKEGTRGIDQMTTAFAKLVIVMEEQGVDVLGDIFQGGITYGEKGQFFTPESVTDLMAGLATANTPACDEADSVKPNSSLSNEFKSVCDPACGSGRILLSIGKEYRNWEFTGQDVDHRCAKMTAINLGLNGLRGWSVWQNSLTLETFRVYKIGLNLHGGVIRDVPVDRSPFDHTLNPTQGSVPPNSVSPRRSSIDEQAVTTKGPAQKEGGSPGSQLDLF